MNTPKQSTYKAHRVFCLTVLLLAMSLPFPVFALDLQEAKSQLLVGESVTGYVGIVKNAEGVAELVNNINAKRKASYLDIAKRNGTTCSENSFICFAYCLLYSGVITSSIRLVSNPLTLVISFLLKSPSFS